MPAYVNGVELPLIKKHDCCLTEDKKVISMFAWKVWKLQAGDREIQKAKEAREFLKDPQTS